MDKAKAAILAAGISLGAGGATLVNLPPGGVFVHRFEVARLPPLKSGLVPGKDRFATANVYAGRFGADGKELSDLGSKHFDLNPEEKACLSKAMDRAASEYK